MQRFCYCIVYTLQLVVVSYDVKQTLHNYFTESEPRLEPTIVEFFEWIRKVNWITSAYVQLVLFFVSLTQPVKKFNSIHTTEHQNTCER